MQETWRWFGPEDVITLEQVRQAGATGIVTALHHIPTGETWPLDDILERKKMIEAAGLTWAVVESLPVHNDIKRRSGNFEQYVENYKASIRHLGEAGIRVVCYNFMPVVDWTRTNLTYELPDRSHTLGFGMVDFAVYDRFVLQRPGAEADYSDEINAQAKTRLAELGEPELRAFEQNIITGLPGGEGSHDREGIAAAIDEFNRLGVEKYREHLHTFLADMIPVAEDTSVVMAIHPDDPPFSLFGLPRVVSTADDARALLAAVPSPSNGLTLCTGSYGARCDNDLVEMIREFHDRIYFVHLRNVLREADGSFYESGHLEGDNDMVGIVAALLDEENDRRRNTAPFARIPMRPDHGHTMTQEQGRPGLRPGYSYLGRLRGLAELRGVIHAVSRLERQAR